MIGFLIKGFIGFLLASLYAPKQYKDEVKKRIDPRYVWHFFLDRVHYFNPQKIVMSGNTQEEWTLRPERYYDISCTGSSRLTLFVSEMQSTKSYCIKNICGSGSSHITLKNHDLSNNGAVNQMPVHVGNLTLSQNAKLIVHGKNLPNFVCAQRYLTDNSEIVTNLLN
jgi:hypothetical protein